jgi:hypothetical protein
MAGMVLFGLDRGGGKTMMIAVSEVGVLDGGRCPMERELVALVERVIPVSETDWPTQYTDIVVEIIVGNEVKGMVS